MTGLEGLKSQILTMSLMKGDSIQSMIYSFLIVTLVEYVFAFSLIAGLAVLYATLIATREERIKEATLMRVFGSSRRQVGVAYVTEFSIIGLVSALIATIAANLLAYYVSAYVLNVPFQFNVLLALSTSLITAFIIPLVAWLGLRGFLNLPARQLLNSI